MANELGFLTRIETISLIGEFLKSSPKLTKEEEKEVGDAFNVAIGEAFECCECGEVFPMEQMCCDPSDGCPSHAQYPEDQFER